MIVLDPKFLTASLINLGFSVAKEFIATLSAPEFSAFSISFKLLIPPPTVNGTKIFFTELSIIL